MFSNFLYILFPFSNMANFIILHPLNCVMLYSIGLIFSFPTIFMVTFFHELGHVISTIISFLTFKLKESKKVESLDIEFTFFISKRMFKSNNTNAYTKSNFRNFLLDTKAPIKYYQTIVFGGIKWGTILILLFAILNIYIIQIMTILIPILGMSTGWVVLNLTRYFSSTHIDTSDRNTILKIRKIKKVQAQLYKIQKSIEKQQKPQANADLLVNELNNLETDFYNSIKKGR